MPQSAAFGLQLTTAAEVSTGCLIAKAVSPQVGIDLIEAVRPRFCGCPLIESPHTKLILCATAAWHFRSKAAYMTGGNIDWGIGLFTHAANPFFT